MHTDDGLRSDDVRVEETDYATKAAKVWFRGKISEEISWNVLYQLDKNVDALERYWVTNKVSDLLDVSVGKQKIKTFGYHRKLATAAAYPSRSSILTSNPLTDKLAVDIVYKLLGSVSLAFVKDYYDLTCTANPAPASPTTPNPNARQACASWNPYDVQKQPAIAFEWLGNLGDIQPLIQYARYDRNHSSTASLGLRYKTDSMDAYADYILDLRNDKRKDATGKAKDNEYKTEGVVLYGEIFTGSWTPYALYSTTNLDEYKGVTEIKTNRDGVVNDNERLIAAGVFYENYGKLYRPYVGFAATSGKYLKAINQAEESRSRFDVMVGLSGKF